LINVSSLAEPIGYIQIQYNSDSCFYFLSFRNFIVIFCYSFSSGRLRPIYPFARSPDICLDLSVGPSLPSVMQSLINLKA